MMMYWEQSNFKHLLKVSFDNWLDIISKLMNALWAYQVRQFKSNTSFYTSHRWNFLVDTNLVLTEREGHTGEYWLEVMAVWTD